MALEVVTSSILGTKYVSTVWQALLWLVQKKEFVLAIIRGLEYNLNAKVAISLTYSGFQFKGRVQSIDEDSVCRPGGGGGEL